jgi:hypothetical protein
VSSKNPAYETTKYFFFQATIYGFWHAAVLRSKPAISNTYAGLVLEGIQSLSVTKHTYVYRLESLLHSVVQGALSYSTLLRLWGVAVAWFLQPQQHSLQPYDSTIIATGNNDLRLLPISFFWYIFGHGG